MTHERDLERLLDSWFTEGPRVVADRVIDDLPGRLARQPQRPAWRLRPWRFPVLPMPVRYAAVGVALITILGAIGLFMAGQSTPPPLPVRPTADTRSASPSATRSGSTSAFDCFGPETTCAGPLTAGEHASTQFMDPFRFTVPAGWQNVRDIPRTYGLEPIQHADVLAGTGVGIQVLGMVAIADQTPTRCDPVPKAGVGTSVDDIVAYVRGHPGLTADPSVPVTLDGHPGQRIDFQVALTWGGSCPGFNPGDPVVLMLTDTGTPAQRTVGYGTEVRVRWTVIDVAGATVIIESVATKASFDTDIAASGSIVDSIDFLPPN